MNGTLASSPDARKTGAVGRPGGSFFKHLLDAYLIRHRAVQHASILNS
jgi:hypothetical protein